MADAGEWKSASWKQEEDFSKETTALLATVNHKEVPVLLRSTTRPLADYIQQLLDLEKKARFGGDIQSARKLAVEAVRIYRVLGKIQDMLELVDSLMRKRAQSKTVQTALIAEASFALGDGAIYPETTTPPEGSDEKDAHAVTDNTGGGSPLRGDAYKDLLQSLKSQTEGKIHLELEHSRLTFRLAMLAVDNNNKREASDLLVGIQVETVTNMPRLEKIQNVLFQLRIAMDLGDDGRFIVLSRKLNPRALAKDDTRALKMQYFSSMAAYYEKHSQWLPMARCWYEIFQVLSHSSDSAAPAVAKMPSAFLEFVLNNNNNNSSSSSALSTAGLCRSLTLTGAISNTALLCLMAPHITNKDLDDQQEFCAFAKSTHFQNRLDLLKILEKERALETEVELMHKLLKTFLSEELIRVASAPSITDLGKHHPLLANFPERREALSARLSEHDLLVISKFYSCAKIERLAELVGLTAERTESYIMALVDAGELFARFDRVDGVLMFEQANKPASLLTEWSKQVEVTAALVERAAQLISKERMVQAGIAE